MTLIERITTEVNNELTTHIIPFWNNLKDDLGGFYGYVDFNLNIDKEAIKGTVVNSRILWFYSNIYLVLGEKQSLVYAKHAYDFLIEHCIDSDFGGVYWAVEANGKPNDKMKHTYCQAFAIYGLSSYYAATNDREALNLAYELCGLIEEKCVDKYGYLEAFDRQWNLISNGKLSEHGYQANKTMNTLLHIIESYTELYRVDKNPWVGECLRKALILFKDKIYDRQYKRLGVFFNTEMKSIAAIHSYGHDIEASWLIDRACEVLNDNVLSMEISNISIEIVKNVLALAYENGALNNECCRGIVDKTKVWWVQAEGMVGFLNAYQKSGDSEYLNAAAALWNYIKIYIIDKRQNSEWYWAVSEKGAPISQKAIVEPWKCPYHNGRMCMEVLKRSELF